MSTKLQITVNGASGHMGRAICNMLASSDLPCRVKYKLDSKSTAQEIKDACSDSDIILDFSSPEGALSVMTILMEYPNCKLLVGTTALQEKHLAYMNKLAESRAIFYAPNTSITANILAELSAKAASILRDFDVEIVESHHRSKKDAPSGTALMIGQKIANARGVDFRQNAVYSRHDGGVRQQDQIGMLSVRGGGIYGDNKVILAGDNEIFTMEARALNRDVFAQGALKAAIWLAGQKAGLYRMQDFLKG